MKNRFVVHESDTLPEGNTLTAEASTLRLAAAYWPDHITLVRVTGDMVDFERDHFNYDNDTDHEVVSVVYRSASDGDLIIFND